jgi:hypothetical protein
MFFGREKIFVVFPFCFFDGHNGGGFDELARILGGQTTGPSNTYTRT